MKHFVRLIEIIMTQRDSRSFLAIFLERRMMYRTQTSGTYFPRRHVSMSNAPPRFESHCRENTAANILCLRHAEYFTQALLCNVCNLEEDAASLLPREEQIGEHCAIIFITKLVSFNLTR